MTDQIKPEPHAQLNVGPRLAKWVDQRTGVNSLLHETLDEPIPGAPAGLISSARGCYSFSFRK